MRRVAFAVALLVVALLACAADLQPVPPFGARVTDLTGTLDAQQKQTLNDELEALEKRKGSRVAVLMVPTTAPEAIEQYSIRVTDSWLLSRTDKHTQDGVLLTIAKDDHRVRIDVGRDLEGAITDAASSRIIREYITPKFRAGDYYGGIHDALGALLKLIDGESLPPPLADDKPRLGSKSVFNAALFAFFAILWARSLFGGLPAPPRGGLTALVGGGVAWLFSGGVLGAAIALAALGFILGLFGGGGGGFANRGGWGGWGGGFGGLGGSGGGSWGGGGGGGGFSGGSSGGFSGGGASGSW